jgi:hypothetical protein
VPGMGLVIREGWYVNVSCNGSAFKAIAETNEDHQERIESGRGWYSFQEFLGSVPYSDEA